MPARRRRHPKKDIEAALKWAEQADWTVEEIHRSHRWGIVRCSDGMHFRHIWSTPADPTSLAKDIRRKDRQRQPT